MRVANLRAIYFQPKAKKLKGPFAMLIKSVAHGNNQLGFKPLLLNAKTSMKAGPSNQ